MSVTVVQGPAYSGGVRRYDEELQTGFRVVSDYNVVTDQLLVRLDAKINGVQLNVGFEARPPRIDAGGGHPSDLAMPQHREGLSIVACHEDIIGALRGLADALEKQIAEEAVHEAEK